MAEGQKETGTEGQGKCWQWRGRKVGDGARKRGVYFVLESCDTL